MKLNAMKQLAVGLALALSLFAPTADATTYYVRIDGSNANVGTTNSAGGAWKTIGKANVTLVAGDTCRVISTYTAPADTASDAWRCDYLVSPQNSGTAQEAIVYVGDDVTQNPTSRLVSGIHIGMNYAAVEEGCVSTLWTSGSTSGNYTLVKWLHAQNESTVGRTNRNVQALRGSRIENCVLHGLRFFGAQNCKVYRSRNIGLFKMVCENDNTLADITHIVANTTISCQYDTVRSNIMDPAIVGDVAYHKSFDLECRTNNCLVDSNRVSGSAASGADMLGLSLYNSKYNTLRANSFHYESAGPAQNGTGRRAWYMRDSTRWNLFEDDTLLCNITTTSANHGDWFITHMTNSGVEMPSMPTGENIWRRNVWKLRGKIIAQHGFDRDVIEQSQFSSWESPGMHILARGPAFTFRNNTVTTSGATAFFLENATAAATQIRCNIFVAGAANNCGQPIFDSDVQGYTLQNNLYWAWSGSAPYSIAWGGPCISPPGGSSYANPAHVDTTWATMNLSPTAGSPALAGWPAYCTNGTVTGFVGAIYRAWVAPDSVTDFTANVGSYPTGVGGSLVIYDWGMPSFVVGGVSGQPIQTVEFAATTNTVITSGNFNTFKRYSWTRPAPGSRLFPPQVFLGESSSWGSFNIAMRVTDQYGNTKLTAWGEPHP